MQSYDYARRKGIDEISWERFGTMSRSLVEQLAPQGIEVVIGVARAGLFPATAVTCALRCEMYPVRLTRRVNDIVTFDHPVWKTAIPDVVKNKVAAVIDELVDTGETLALVANGVREQGAARVITASLIAHTWANPMPDHVALVTDALVIFPWDKEVYINGAWQPHPELVEALKAQNNG